nr:MAG TPA: protein of unknown function DUF761 [Caudoviricetes sp.]
MLRLPSILAKLMNLRLTAGAVPYGVASLWVLLLD